VVSKYIGHSFDFDVSPLEVTSAEILKVRISVDWLEDGERGHLEATSADDMVYRGNYGYTKPNPDYHFELRLYRATNGDPLLFGRWWRTDEPEGGSWLFRLSPDPKG
jgi:hypothetical protein